MAVLSIRSGIHYEKKKSPAESHVLVSANTGTSEYVYDNETAVPSNGDFSATALLTDTSGNAGIGRWSLAPDSSVVMCNKVGNYVWAGTTMRLAAFMLGDSTGPSSDITFNYTDDVNNASTAATDIALLTRADDTKVYMYIGFVRPVDGIYFQSSVNNAAAASMAVKYWDGTAWAAVSNLSDGTVTGSATWAKSGWVTWDSTASTAKLKTISNYTLYFYQVTITGFTADTNNLTYAYAKHALFQTIQDIWDGQPRPIAHAELRTAAGTAIAGQGELTNQINSINRVEGDQTTYFVIYDPYGITSQSIMLGFLERMQGLYCVFKSGSAVSGTVTISYWNGTAWTAVSGQADTTDGFFQTGWVTWTAPSQELEHKYSLSGEPPMYYYRVTFTGTFNSWLDYVAGMPAQQILDAYEFPATWQNRTVLAGSVTGESNSIRISGYGSTSVWNGADSLTIDSIGDDSPITAVGGIFSRQTAGFYDTLVICKSRETWVLDGTTVRNYRLYRVSDRYGCVAPGTFATMQLSREAGGRGVAVWQAATGIALFDGNNVQLISYDIKNFFEQGNSQFISRNTIDDSMGFIDEREQEYHWIFTAADGAHELVYSFRRQAWFEISRGSGAIVCGIPVHHTAGASFVYGGMSTGYLILLEDPYYTTFTTGSSTTAITNTVETRDMPMNSWTAQSLIRRIKLATVAVYSDSDITVSHFGDGNNVADSATSTLAQEGAGTSSTTGYRVTQSKAGTNWGHHVLHRFKFVATATEEEGPGETMYYSFFEPIAFTGFYQDVRLDL